MRKFNITIVMVLAILLSIFTVNTVFAQGFDGYQNIDRIEALVFVVSDYSNPDYNLISRQAEISGDTIINLFEGLKGNEVDVNITELSGRRATADNLLKTINKLWLNEQTAFVLYIVAHGGYYENYYGKNIDFIIGADGKAVKFYTIKEKVESKGAANNTLLIDSCSIKIKINMSQMKSSKSLSYSSAMILSLGDENTDTSSLPEPKLISQYYREIQKPLEHSTKKYILDLFTGNRGTTIIKSSSPDERAFLAYKGSLFSLAFSKTLRELRVYKNFAEIEPQIVGYTNELFEDLLKNNYLSDYEDELNGQTNQNPDTKKVAIERYLDKEKSEILVRKGERLVKEGQYYKALDALDEAIEVNWLDSWAWAYRGVIAYIIGDYKTARYCLEKAWNMDPYDYMVRYLYFKYIDKLN
jgi:hypothetical protein